MQELQQPACSGSLLAICILFKVEKSYEAHFYDSSKSTDLFTTKFL